MTAMRSAIDSASSWSCVTRIVVIAVFALQPLHLDLHVEAEVLVERAERLVEQQDLRVDRERARKRHPLLLTAGELPRQPLARTAPCRTSRSISATRSRSAPAAPARLEAVRDVLRNAHVREQRVVLEHDAAPRSLASRCRPARRRSARCPRLGNEAGDDAQQRRLAAAARAEQRHELPAGDIRSISSTAVTSPKRCVTRSSVRRWPVRAVRLVIASQAPCASFNCRGTSSRPTASKAAVRDSGHPHRRSQSGSARDRGTEDRQAPDLGAEVIGDVERQLELAGAHGVGASRGSSVRPSSFV